MNEEPNQMAAAPMAPPPAPLPARPQATKPLSLGVAAPPPPPQVPPPAPVIPQPEEESIPLDEAILGSKTTIGSSPRADDDARVPLPDDSELEDYTIIRKLGRGGFGITYLARHTEKGTVVVIKEHMPRDLAVREPDSSYVMGASPEKEADLRRTLEEFMEEVTVMQALSHPGIVPILSSFEANGTAYYVMPYVEGKTLEISVKPTLDKESRRRDARTIRQQLSSLLDTLEYMEQHQVVHRDIKPENIVIDTEGRIILLDFGSARQIVPGKVFSNIFTPDFCAPEQALAKDDEELASKLGPWTDIYSLGATFHYLITRMLPPRADMRGYAELDPYKPLASRPDLCKLYGGNFLKAIDRAMEMSPKNRWQSATDWRQSISSGLLPSSPRVMQRARIIMAASAVLVAVFGGVGLWAIKERNQAVQMYNMSLQLSEGILYDFNEELSDVPGATKLQAQLITQLKNYLDEVDRLSLASDEKLQRALSSAWLSLGYTYIEQGNLESATEALLRATGLQERLVHENPDNRTYRYNLARIWLYRAEVARRRNLAPTAEQFIARAMDELTGLCTKNPGNPDYKCMLGKALDETASLARANGNRDLYETSVKEQLVLYEELSKVYPRNTAVLTGFGYALLSAGQLSVDSDDYSTALSHFERAKEIFAELSSNNPYRLSFKKGLASVYHSMGALHARMGELKSKGRKQLDEAALIDFENQMKLARELAALDPDNAEYTFMECRTMSEMVEILIRTKRVNKAVAFCNTILEKTETLLATAPDNVDYALLKAGALRGLAMAHGDSQYEAGQATEEFQESRIILERMLSQTPGNLSMRFLYMQILEESARHAASGGDVRQARRWLELAIVIVEKLVAEDPENKMLTSRLEALRKQLNDLKDK